MKIQHGQGSAQLVGGIGNEALFAHAQLAQPLQQSIQGASDGAQLLGHRIER